MRRITSEAVVAAEPQAAWDLYSDVAGSVEWVPFADEILYVSGPAGLGQVYRERTRLGGVSGVSEWRVVEWEPPRRQVQRSTDMNMESLLIIEVEPADGGARIRQSVELRSRLPGPFGWLHEQVFGLVAGRGIRQAVAAARRRLDGR